ncbi:hypothetical protein FSP39_021058, partial [Pinctada imbricata]
SLLSFSGPTFWALQNSDWRMCSHGKQQSPINISPELLLYDPNLGHISLNISNGSGQLVNTGNDITLFLQDGGLQRVNVTDGPLSYVYAISDIKFHFGRPGHARSEHQISNKTFPAEVGHCHNLDIFQNVQLWTLHFSYLTVRGYIKEKGRISSMTTMHSSSETIPGERNVTNIDSLPVSDLIPLTDEYMTYEGSLTQPGCHESVTWIILNKPVFVTRNQVLYDVSLIIYTVFVTRNYERHYVTNCEFIETSW